jgi:diacylglycerol kinase family enzyme
MIDHDHLVNGAALGLAAAVVRATPHALKKHIGTLGYLLVGRLEVPFPPPDSHRLIEDVP